MALARTFDIACEDDIVLVRSAARLFAEELRFSAIDKTRIATAVSELARNTLVHGGGGRAEIIGARNGTRVGIRCVFVDEGPGIADVPLAMTDGFSTTPSLGQGLPGARRLMDRMDIESGPSRGTRVEVIKWL